MTKTRNGKGRSGHCLVRLVRWNWRSRKKKSRGDHREVAGKGDVGVPVVCRTEGWSGVAPGE